MISVGYVKRGRGYGKVEVAGRYQLPIVEAVRYRWPGGEWVITKSDRVLTAKPKTEREQSRDASYKELAEALSTDWQSMSELLKKMTGFPGVWGMCKKLERINEVEMREVNHKPNRRDGWRCEARLKQK